MLPLTVPVILSVFALRVNAIDEDCVSPKAFGFQSCAPGWAVAGVPVKQMSVYNEAQCARECVNNPECESINFRINPSFSGLSECELHPRKVPCGSLDPMPGYVNMRQLETFHACISEASQVRGAAFMGNNSYMLFFDSTMQMFKLTDQVLYAVECPITLTDYFLNWPGPPQAVFRSDALLATGPFYVVHDNKVHQYVSTGTQAFPSMFSPWPLHIFDFFNVSISGNVTAVFTTGDRFYACTDDGIYVSKYESFVKLLPVSGIPEFSLSDVTAVATETGLDSLLIFIDNTYYLFDFTGNTVYGRGKVCTNL